MTLSDFTVFLKHMDRLNFKLSDGSMVAPHFHITEVGQIDRNFIDCGGTVRKTSKVNFQMYVATDVDHRLAPSKLLRIINESVELLGIDPSLEIQVEFQGRSIENYGLVYDQGVFVLDAKQTDCLAKDKCGIPVVEEAVAEPAGKCAPGSGCC